MICDDCIHQWECWDQRGLGNQYKSKEELRKQIESINQKYRTAERTGADKGCIQEAGPVQQQQAHESSKAPMPVQSETDTGAEKEAGWT